MLLLPGNVSSRAPAPSRKISTKTLRNRPDRSSFFLSFSFGYIFLFACVSSRLPSPLFSWHGEGCRANK